MDGERKEEIAEDVCFFCKDGGELRICDFKSCLKAYHAPCVGKDLKFLELDEYWTCGWHSCFLCQKSSIFQCFCCPRSVCAQCMGAASFVVLRKGKGFCVECLKLALMIENDMDVDSDGGQVDFTDTETLEFLFKDYWPILKEKEKLSIDDLHKADEILKKTSKDTRIILDKNSDDDMKTDKEYSQEDVETIGRSAFRSKGTCISSKVKKIVQRYKSKKKQFIGWGSKELIGFLQSIGKATDKEFSQAEVFEIVKEYIQENKLLNPHKRKRVLCDSRLRALFGRKSISRLKINDLLDPHFASNEMPDDEASYSSEDENDRKCRKLGSNQKSGKSAWKRNTMAAGKNAFACITVKNIRAVYLKRSLVEEFLKSVESFDSKVTGCFVRIRSDAKAIHRSSHTLVQVTGTKNLTENYRTGNMQTNIVLLVSDSDKDIRIHMISEDEFTEEECEELCQIMRQGLVKRPTVEELERKVFDLHEDITNHRIKKEIVLLQNLMKRANEKGWRRELMEYAEKLEILQRPDEQARLVQELPTIVADAETEVLVVATEIKTPDHGGKEAENANTAVQRQVPESEGNITEIANVTAKRETGTAMLIINTEPTEGNVPIDPTMKLQLSSADADDEKSHQKKRSADGDHGDGCLEKASTGVDSSNFHQHSTIVEETQERKSPISEHETLRLEKGGGAEGESALWMYGDPSGAIQGPFSLEELREWYEEGYFAADFKVWKKDQSQVDAFFLVDVLRQEAVKPQ
ncbi:uncharacterized protein At5g08430-like isoform X2 [Nymphaea colorata]|nr:uncharacterized protein At5g08430-like isoform X2 [Nymphaea colorata]XP_049931416.1 uncharacterized protein At5g08430-like isoform X2 [Nymphaea colorata]XP_049931417.1 uncharacterized protein At5g08430-like isoform X2 [Nymphaea colorata]